jgi:uncharacterized lipoprotein YmbA
MKPGTFRCVVQAESDGLVSFARGPCSGGQATAEAPPSRRGWASTAGRALLGLAVCLNLTGCFGFLKPAQLITRSFVLTPLPAPVPGSNKTAALAVGVGQVKVPTYLLNSALAVRQGTNEITYSESVVWAERLDAGIQRVLAANLGIILATDQVRLTRWRVDEVAAEVYVVFERFDIDAAGQGFLVARWRILGPGGEKALKTGESRLSREGPLPAADPSGAVGTLSDLLGDLSHQVAGAIQATKPNDH